MKKCSKIIFYNGSFKKQFDNFIININLNDYFIFNIGNEILNENILNINYVFSKFELDQITKTLLHITKNWYKNSNFDFSIINGYSYGEYLEYDLKFVFLKMIKYISIIDKLNPNEIVYYNDNSAGINSIIEYCQINKIKKIDLNLDNIYFKSQKIYEWPTIYKKNNFIILKQFFKIFYSNIKLFFKNKEHKSIYIEQHKFTETIIDYGLTKNFNIYSNSMNKFKMKSLNHHFITDKLYFGLNYSYINQSTFLNKLLISSYANDNAYFKKINLFKIIFDTFYKNLYKSFTFFSINVKYFEKYFLSNKITSAIILQDSVGINKIIQIISNKIGIKTFLLLHGIPGIKLDSHLEFKANYILTFGDLTTNFFNKIYPNAFSVGNKYFSSLKKINYSKINFPTSKIVLFVCEPISNFYLDEEPYSQNLILNTYCNIAKKNSDTTFIFRFHPSTKYYEELESKINLIKNYNLSNIFIDNGYDLNVLINSIDIIIASASTVAFESILLGKIFLCFDPFYLDYANYIKYKAGYATYNFDELDFAIKESFKNISFKNKILINSKIYISKSLDLTFFDRFEENIFNLIV